MSLEHFVLVLEEFGEGKALRTYLALYSWT